MGVNITQVRREKALPHRHGQVYWWGSEYRLVLSQTQEPVRNLFLPDLRSELTDPGPLVSHSVRKQPTLPEAA